MILFDLSQICMANLMVHLEINKDEFDSKVFKFMVFDTIRKNMKEFKKEYGENVVIACDSTKNWRKTWFKYYKANRKAGRDASDIDWKTVFETIESIKEDIKNNFHYRLLCVEECEADDVIGTLCEKFGEVFGGERILILSGDKDFIQLQKFGNVFQYNPIKKSKITHNDPEMFLIEHIISGDKSDGVPNILSPDDIFITQGRQTTLSSKRVTKIKEEIKEGVYDTAEYHRNKTMIDLTMVPEYLKINIMSAYEAEAGKNKLKILNYLIKSRMGRLVESVGDF